MLDMDHTSGIFLSHMNEKQQRQLVETANILADAARPIALKYFRSGNFDLQNKEADGFDPVTRADQEVEAALRDILARRRPDDGVLGEEYENTVGTSGLTWVLDPIDGTRGFISGTPTWGVLIALDDGNGPVLGLIDQPYTQERFFGGFGTARLTRGSQVTPLGVRSGIPLEDAILFTTMPEIGSAQERAAFEAVSARARLTRFGLDCYAYGLLACGQIDLVIEADLKPFDIQGPMGVVQGAGGIVTDWHGGPAHHGGQIIAAASPELHASALEILQGSLQA